MDLFSLSAQKSLAAEAPLAERMRPRSLSEFVGQSHLIGPGKYLTRLLKAHKVVSMLFYGPPGVGKTTLAGLIAKESGMAFSALSAVAVGVKELREVLAEAKERLGYEGRRTILFIDEIHRFNKAQQDALLPYVEKGEILLIGATTENPYFEVNRALLSRMQVINLHALEDEDISRRIDEAIADRERGLGVYPIVLTEEGREELLRAAHGDLRTALNGLEIASLTTEKREGKILLGLEDIHDSLQERKIAYDKKSTGHYDAISAFIKSMRGSDPDAALYWLGVMLAGGEDPKFIARRMIIFASEDIGLADARALSLAVAAFDAVHIVGMPEGRITLAHAATYLALAEKSNRTYMAIGRVEQLLKHNPPGEVPMVLRDVHNPRVQDERIGRYLYPHDDPRGWVEQDYLPKELVGKRFYEPGSHGEEAAIVSQWRRRRGEDT